MTKICAIESDSSARSRLTEIISAHGYGFKAFEAPHALITALQTQSIRAPDLVIFGLIGVSVPEVMAQTAALKNTLDSTPILILTDTQHIPQTVESIRAGASNYVLISNLETDLKRFIDLVLQSPVPSPIEILFEDFPTLTELEKRYMKIVLQKTKGRKERAAKILGINRRTLYRKEREYGWVNEESEEISSSEN